MNSFLKTYLKIIGITFGILLFFGLLVLGLSKLFGVDNALIITYITIIILGLSFAITITIEDN